MLRLLIISFLVLNYGAVLSQTTTISGTIKGANDSEGLPGATVLAERTTAPPLSLGVVTDFEGNFRLEKVEPGTYAVKFQFIGYQQVEKEITVGTKAIELGDIVLPEETQTLDEIQVTATTMAGEQKGDTSIFNAAAFKTMPDASAEDLVQKMPGIMMVDGKLQAQGEDVQQILIDGKPFFGEDVQAALQSLPSEVIASIEIFDRKSDQAEMSGFDDGERIRTINIVTKKDRRKGQFGKTSGGLGTDSRYMAGTNLNMFNEERRTTISGLSNNINVLNYSASPNAGADSRTQDGIINNNAVALNFADTYAEKLELSGSYLYNNRTDEISQIRRREFVLPSDSGQVYRETNFNTNTNSEHRVFLRADFKINERNRILWRPSVSFGNELRNSAFVGRTDSESGPINETENTSNADQLDYDYFNRLFYSHKFLKPGRSFTFSLNNSLHSNEEDRFRNATNIFYNGAEQSEILNQFIRWDRKGSRWNTKVAYSEPLSEKSRIELEYSIGNRKNDSDRRLFNYSEQLEDYSLLDVALSNTFNSEYLTQEYELGYQLQGEKLKAQVEVEYQDARLMNEQFFPIEEDLDRRFNAVLPSARFEYKFSDITNIEINSRTWTNEPSVGQLQSVIDNSNPLQLRTGNPDLDQTYSSWTRMRLRSNNAETNRSMYAGAQTIFTGNFIGTSTFIADEQTPLLDDIVLEKGSQLIRPVNLDGYWQFRSYFGFGQPLSFIKSNIHINGGMSYTSRPGLINDELNLANTANYRAGFSLSSNVSERLDFRIGSWTRYNVVENTLRPSLNNNFFNQTTRFWYNWIFGDGFVFRTDLNYQINGGLSEGFDNTFLLWNMSVGKKVFKNKLGEVSVNVYDMLKQNNNIRRNISEIFIEDMQSNVLNRYVMLSFTYNFRRFSKGASMDDFEDIETN